ncbi:3-deoxy-manno-octulosonate cytidylyltransferase [Pseudomonas sp. PDM23]|uniref:3-deoxy-manno-octulosonate cytidylyltransferase n=1 Tax=unclassified Pseudomonas TaxID=196821 RepID=UPI00178253E7|nr:MULTISPECIES: 3-deoxy-manno-octulosonate cytidylyltransferase [unclassified Pseudomonas]MBD9576478.1 3-deoxy-manno-octulosonate cytidylyltransferase [Pseudomonas sp. PDM23]MBD9670405.1 3-deoxy-manno-octulosonate cytidylyltransferase [Pseudomonas sp. PDM21]
MVATPDYAVIIPARYQSSRLPGKPLVQLNGVPMIVRTYRQCLKACPAERIHVATDDDRIREVCEQHDISVLMTSSQCLTGTDRLAECAQQLDAEVFINVQGDEPVFNPDDLRRMIEACGQWPGEVLNGYCAIEEEAQFRSTSTPKVVLRPDGRLLYMSRATIPGTKSNEFVRGWRQVCLYAFPRESLAAFAACDSKTPLESLEDIEILRFLELGWEVRMLELSQDSIAVDNPEDVDAAEAAIRARNL